MDTRAKGDQQDAESPVLPRFRSRHPQSQRRLKPVTAYADLRAGIDVVVRRGQRCFIVDTWGAYAEIEVTSDVLTPEGAAQLRNLSGRRRAGMIDAIVQTGYLSYEGKVERLVAMGVIPLRFEAAW